MSSIKCPYDYAVCEEKELRLEEWRAAIEHFAKNHINFVHYTSADMFEGCPRDRLGNAKRQDCVRYQRYLNIVNKINAKNK